MKTIFYFFDKRDRQWKLLEYNYDEKSAMYDALVYELSAGRKVTESGTIDINAASVWVWFGKRYGAPIQLYKIGADGELVEAGMVG